MGIVNNYRKHSLLSKLKMSFPNGQQIEVCSWQSVLISLKKFETLKRDVFMILSIFKQRKISTQIDCYSKSHTFIINPHSTLLSIKCLMPLLTFPILDIKRD